MGNQRTKQLRERWYSYLNPTLEPAYTETEDQALMTLYAMIGPHWARIAGVIGKKSAISARNRYRSLQSMKARGVKPDYERTAPPVTVSQVQPIEEQIPSFPDFDLEFRAHPFSDPWNADLELFLS
jgi:hypothetical protein